MNYDYVKYKTIIRYNQKDEPCTLFSHLLSCVSEIIIIGSVNVLSPGRRQAIIWTNADMLLIGPLGTIFSEILLEIHTFSFNKMHLKM